MTYQEAVEMIEAYEKGYALNIDKLIELKELLKRSGGRVYTGDESKEKEIKPIKGCANWGNLNHYD